MTKYPPQAALMATLLLGLSACATAPLHDPGDISKPQSQTMPTALHFDCGDLSVLLSDPDSAPALLVEGESVPMRQTRAASGVRFEGASDPTTVLHMKGETAWVSVGGRESTNCTLAVPPATPFTAQGQEPPWRVQVLDDVVTLTTGYAGEARTLTLSRVEQAGLTTIIQAADRSGAIELKVVRELCRDSMSGMPHPFSAMLAGVEGAQPGCAGRPIDLLAGREWIIASLDGVVPIDGPPVTLRFMEDTGRIAGAGSCNRYHADYSLDGESLRFSDAAMTKMACAPDLMDQERRFHSILNGITSFDINESGHLILQGTDGRLLARAERLAQD